MSEKCEDEKPKGSKSKEKKPTSKHLSRMCRVEKQGERGEVAPLSLAALA